MKTLIIATILASMLLHASNAQLPLRDFGEDPSSSKKSSALNSDESSQHILAAKVNECATNNGGCGTQATCTANPAGKAVCKCFTGYSGHPCTNINECATNNGGCASTATCTDSPGSFSCACNSGYTGSGTSCFNINECESNNGGCASTATCTDSTGSFSCACNSGYTGSGTSCFNINECESNNGGCASTATCTDSTGSFSCACNIGYTGTGVSCTNVNECTSGAHNCDTNAQCTDSTGSFTCKCNAGYVGSGTVCNHPPGKRSYAPNDAASNHGQDINNPDLNTHMQPADSADSSSKAASHMIASLSAVAIFIAVVGAAIAFVGYRRNYRRMTTINPA